MSRSILFTQCLQHDFVGPLGPFEPMPCALHIGSREAERLLGPNPDEGPLSRFMRWSYQQDPDGFAMIHVLDYHDGRDPHQADHLRHFGAHCLAGTKGAEFVFHIPAGARIEAARVESRTLNDFLGTTMPEVLSRAMLGVTRAGIVGAWTDAKVTFLAYELRSRYPHLDIAVCSALTASSSRERHLLALDHLERIVGVRVLHSVGQFAEYLCPSSQQPDELPARTRYLEGVRVHCDRELEEADREILAWLYRGCSEVTAKTLDGGFSGNVVLSVDSVDLHGHRECPHVVKIGPRELTGRERMAFETIEPVLGNSAPRIVDYADVADRGGLKYRYASMTRGGSRTLQSLWKKGLAISQVEEVLVTVLEEQLGRLYQVAAPEQCDLLSLWEYHPRYAGGIENQVRALGVTNPEQAWIRGTQTFLPIVPFYRDTLPRHLGRHVESVPMARVHGDLNGANILVDDHQNVWLIDFFHSRRHHVICDFAKLENDLLFIWTPIPDESVLGEHLLMLDVLAEFGELGELLPEAEVANVAVSMRRTWDTLRILRRIAARYLGLYRNPWHRSVAALRYAAHTLSFDEAQPLQKLAALYASGKHAARCQAYLDMVDTLRVDFVPLPAARGRLGITLLPGRRDRGRNLDADIRELKRLGAHLVVALVTDDELAEFGVSDLPRRVCDAGLEFRRLPLLDQRAGSLEDIRLLVEEILGRCRAGETVVVHCVGGLGRSGMLVACALVAEGLSPREAIARVREYRSPRAVETLVQEECVERFGAGCQAAVAAASQ